MEQHRMLREKAGTVFRENSAIGDVAVTALKEWGIRWRVSEQGLCA